MLKTIFRRIYSIYWIIAFLSLTQEIFCDGYITTRRPIVEYNMKSSVRYFQLDFNLDSNLIAGNYIRLQFPLSLHQITQAKVYASVVKSSSTSINPTTLDKIYSLVSTGLNEYTFITNFNLDMNVFYSIYVFPEEVKTFGWFSQGIRILTISDNANPIVYSKNVNSGSLFVKNVLTASLNDLRYFNIIKLADSDSTISNNIDSSVSTSLGITSTAVAPFNAMGIKYWLSLYIKIDTTINGGAFFRFSIDPPGNTEFILLNFCKIFQLSNNIQVTPPINSCNVDLNENFLEASIVGDLQQNDEFEILVGIQNAYYSIQNDVSIVVGNYYTRQLFIYRKISNALVTQAIKLTVERLNLFFGVAYNDQEKNFPLGVFQSSSSSSIPVYNSISLSFHAEDNFNLPGSRKLRAILNVAPTTEVLSQSIKTNLVAITDSEVYCKYLNSQIICDNIGPIVALKRYQISFKAFFNEQVVQTQFTDFCSLTIQEYRVSDPKLSFLSTQGIYVKLFVNKDLRDLSATGWQSQAFEQTSVISAPEKPTLKDIYDYAYSTTTGSVGITPDTQEQAILFLMKATEKEYCNSNLSLCANESTILFNHNVIKFTSGKESNGIDFAAMNSSGQLDQSSFRCVANSYCDRYDSGSVKNTKKLILKDSTETDETSMGLVFFDCGVLQKDLDPGIKPSAVSNCLNLVGKGTSVGSNGIIALRNVRFDPKFKHNTYFADDTVLDFVITFMRGIMINSQIPKEYEFISTNLINAYTIVRSSLTTVKYGYINYYVDSTNKFNDGYDIPVLFRLGGSFPSSSAQSIVKIAIFLDEAIDLSNFYWNKTSNDYVEKPYSYGCSEKECYGYKVSAGGSLDAYHLHNTILVNLYSTTDITQPFNIIVPLANNGNGIQPKRVVVGLINDQNQMQAVFRLFGPPSLGDTTVAIQTPALQGLATQPTPYAFPFQPAGNKFSYQADGSNVKSSQTGSILLKAATDTTIVVKGNTNGLWGAGLTVVCRNQDIFTSSRTSINFKNHPGSFRQCTLAKYNLVNHPSGNGLNGSYYALYCPVDEPLLPTDFFKTDKADLINISTPFSYFWGSNLKLQYFLQYALSDNNGYLLASQIEANTVSAPVSNMQKCIIDQTLTVIQPNSRGKQILAVPISFNQDYYFDPLSLTSILKLEFNDCFMIEITFSDVVNGFVLDGSYCVVKGYLQFQDYFECTPTWSSNQIARMKLKAKQSFIFEKGKTFQVELQANENASVNFDKTSVVYSVNIMLPDTKLNPKDNLPSVFSAPDTTKVITESCTGGSLQLGSTPLDNKLEIKNMRTKFINQRGRGYLKIDFSILSTRYRINKGSYFLMDIGFLKDQNMNDNQRMDILDCSVLQNLKANTVASYEISFFFSQISYTASNEIKITLKNDLENPQNYSFQLFCLNIRTPSNIYQSDPIIMSLRDVENIEYFSYVNPIYYSDINFVAILQNNLMELLSWTGYSEGQFTNYKFKIPNKLIGQDITQFSRIYANFPASFNSKLSDSISCKQNDIQVNCSVDPTHPRLVQIQLNQGPIIPDDSFTLEINNLANSYIDPSFNGVYICLIRDFRNQIEKTDFLLCDFQGIIGLPLKQAVNTASVKNIDVRRIYNKAASNSNIFYYGKDQVFSIDMSISKGMFDYKNFLLVELPSVFSKFILNSDPVSCEINTSSRQDNLSYGCSYLNQRYIKISLVKDPQNYFSDSLYTLNLYNLYIPESISGLLADQIYFSFLIYDFNLQNVLAYSYSYSEKPLNFISDTSLARLKWVNTDSFTIYKGYYKSQFILNPQDNTIFLSQFTLKKSQTFPNLLFTSDPLLVTVGSSSASLQIAGSSSSLIGKSLKGQQIQYFLSNNQKGLYNIDFIKSVNEKNYQKAPRLTINLQNTPCILSNKFDQILIVQDGQMVIQIDLDNCIPLNAFQIKATILDPTATGIFLFTDDTQISIVDVAIGSLRIYLEVKCKNTSTPDSTLDLQLEVINNQDYLPNPKNIVLKVQDAKNQLSNPQPDPINFSTQIDNYINISVGCDQPGYIVWVSGASNLNYEKFDSNYMYDTFVGQKNYKSCQNTNDYCYDFILMNQPSMQFQIYIPNLVSRQLYFFKYFCRNQIGMFSNERSFTFRANDNQGRMNKIILQLNKSITDSTQIQSVLCFVSQKLVANYLRIVDPNNLSCEDKSLYTTTIKRIPDNIFYIYVLPNLKVSNDQTTANVKSSLATYSVFTDIIQGIGASIVDYKTEMYDDQVIPDFEVTQFSNDKTSLKMQVNFKTYSGFFIIGFITLSESLPQKEQFLKSVNYLNQPIAKMQKFFIPKGLTRNVEFSISNLVQDGRLYNSLFIAVPDNPQFGIDYTSDLQNKTFSIPKTAVDVDITDPQTSHSMRIQSLIISIFILILC